MAWVHFHSHLGYTRQESDNSLVSQHEGFEDNYFSLTRATYLPPFQAAPTSYSDEQIHVACENYVPTTTHHGCSDFQNELHAVPIASSVTVGFALPHLPPLSAPPTQFPSATSVATEEAEQPVTVEDIITDNGPKIKVRKNKVVLGEPAITFQCIGQDYIRLSGQMLEQDLQTMYDPDYRGFFDGLGEKVTYVIAFRNGSRFVSKQRYCRQVYQGVTYYFTRERIAREVAQVIQEFLKIHPDFTADGVFHDWPAGSTVDNMALVGLRKVSRASVQIFPRYCPSYPSQI